MASNPQPKASTLVGADEPVHLEQPGEAYVSRGGRKLAGALDAFDVGVRDLRGVDVGASTGGFTDCLLQRGIASVVAVDVGYGQMHWRIRNDPRVEVVERTNIRTADTAALGAPFDVVVGDLSFISLRTIVDAMSRLGNDDASWVLLVKPQFEVDRGDVGKGGIVRDATARMDAVRRVVDTYAEHALRLHGLIASPIKGTTGNVEYVAWFRRTEAAATRDELFAAVEDHP